MNIIIKGLHIDLTDAIESYLTKKLGSLAKFVDEDTKVEVNVGKTTAHHKSGNVFQAEIRVRCKGDLARVRREAGDLYAAIDEARDEMLDILSSKKDKKKTLLKKGAQTIKKMTHGERVGNKKSKKAKM